MADLKRWAKMRKSLVITWLVTLTGCALLPQMETHEGFSAYKPLGFAATTEPDGSWGISMAETSAAVDFRRIASRAEFQKEAESSIESSRAAYSKWSDVSVTPISTLGHLKGEGYLITVRDAGEKTGMEETYFLLSHNGWWMIRASCPAGDDVVRRQLHSILESLRVSE